MSLSKALSEVKSGLFGIFATVILCAALGCLAPKGAVAEVFETVAALAVISALCGPVTQCIKDAARVITDSALFLMSYVPVYAMIITAGGQPVSAAGYQFSVMAAAELVSGFAADVLVPMCAAYLALCLAGGIAKNAGITGLAGALRKTINWSLTLAMTLFIGLLTLQGFMSAAADVRPEDDKDPLGTFVPVVGV